MADGPAQTVIDRALKALDEIMTLRVVTIQGRVSLTLRREGGDSMPASGLHAITEHADVSVDAETVVATTIDLVDGDVKTLAPPDFFQPEQAGLRTYHADQVRLAREIVEKNVVGLVDLVNKLR